MNKTGGSRLFGYFIGVLLLIGFAVTGWAEGTNSTENNKKVPTKGIKFKPFPLLNYDSDAGMGYGLCASLLSYDGQSEDYLWKIYVEYFATTGGQMDPDIRFDIQSIKIGNQPIRIQGMGEYLVSLFDPFYGVGSSDAETGYNPAIAANSDTADVTNRYFYNYKKVNPYLYFTLSTPVLWGRNRGYDKTLDFLLGSFIEGYSFTNSTPPDKPMQLSKLITERPYGIDGGLVVSLMTGFRFDNRDFQLNAHKGTYNELMFEFTVGGVYTYSRLTFKHSWYWEPFKKYKRLVFAERFMFDHLFGDPPFFKLQKVGGVQPLLGIGGSETIRGIPQYRFIGTLKMIFNPELRWRFLDFGPFLGDMWHLEGVLFSDIGNAWMGFSDIQANEIYASWGLGLRILWGEDFIIAADFGFWNGETGIYIGFDHQF